MSVSPVVNVLSNSINKPESALTRMNNSMAQAFASVGTATARPQFELMFNQLQNQVIDRLNLAITKIEAENNVKHQMAELSGQHRRLSETYENLETVRSQMSSNVFATKDIIASIDDASRAITSDDKDLSEADRIAVFDRSISRINDLTSSYKKVDGWRIGLNNLDGTEKLKRTGILQINGKSVESFDDIQKFVDGENVRISAENEQVKADFKLKHEADNSIAPPMSDADFEAALDMDDGKLRKELEALQAPELDAMTVARQSLVAATIGGSHAEGTLPKGVTATGMIAVHSRVVARADSLVTMIDQTQVSLQKVELEMLTTESADLADKAGRAEKIRQDYGLMLESVSLAFEGSQGMVDNFSSRLFSSGEADKGSALSLFI